LPPNAVSGAPSSKTVIVEKIDVPRVANGLRVFDRMVQMSRSFADSLGGTLADDNRKMLNDSGLDRIRAQLRAIYDGLPSASRADWVATMAR